MTVPNIVTCFPPWGRTDTIPLRLACIARPRFAAGGLAGCRRPGEGLAMQVSTIEM
jgi:hypothetical protein